MEHYLTQDEHIFLTEMVRRIFGDPDTYYINSTHQTIYPLIMKKFHTMYNPMCSICSDENSSTLVLSCYHRFVGKPIGYVFETTDGIHVEFHSCFD